MVMVFLLLFFIALTGDTSALTDTIIISDWYYLGPFSIGPREGIIGLDLDFSDENFQPDTTAIYPSFLMPGGFVKWKRIHTDDGRVEIKYEDVLWDTIQDYYGAAGLLCASIVYGEFECAERLVALVSAKEVGSFILNGKAYPADAYGDGYVQIPVILNKGKNRVVLRPSGYGQHKFSFKIITNPEPIVIIKDITLPDFIKGKNYSGYIGVPIMNTTEEIIKNIKVEVTGGNILRAEKEISRLMPLSVTKVPLLLMGEAINVDSVLIRIFIIHNYIVTADSCWIKVKNPDEPYVRTFLSKIDNSCQYYAVLPPKDYSPDSTYALIMTCHGAGVEAINQVKSYTQKDWAFIVAPTNRRRFGFDWQDWGRLDFLEVLEDVKENFKIDTNRIYLTGHSMGGHGVWHIGLAHPDLFAAIAPSAGWMSFQLYIPWFLQRSEIFAQPDQIRYRDMVLREDIAPLFLENASNLPIYILHGGADDNVPPIQGRMMAQYLKEINYDFVYNEVEKMGHWWDIDSTAGIDCVDLKEMMDFLRDKKRNPCPAKIVFKTSDIAHANQAYWVRIEELEDIYQDARIEVEVIKSRSSAFCGTFNRDTIIIKITNIARFKLSLNPSLFSTHFIAIDFIINGQLISYPASILPTELEFFKDGKGFKIGRPKKAGLRKTENLYGPIKRAYFSPFILVYGTIGDSTDTEKNLHQARLQSYTWWIRANGYAEIVPDTELTEEEIKNFNLILFGNSQTNGIIKRINKVLPINFKKCGPGEDCIVIKGKVLGNSDLCLIELYPNPLNPERFVLLYSPTTKRAQRYLGLFSVIYSASGLPDFIIWDSSARRYGWGGVTATGFFDKDWQIERNLIFLRE